MAYKVKVSVNAEKTIAKLDKTTASRILDALEEIAKLDDPRSRGKALIGNKKGLWRYRVGDYRIICDIDDGILVVIVVDVGHRSDIYKKR